MRISLLRLRWLSKAARILTLTAVGLMTAAPPVALAQTVVNATVSITASGFSPATVTISPGGSVTWINNDTKVHSAVSPGGAFDSGPINPGQQYSRPFPAEGTFGYSSYFDCHDDTGVWRQSNGSFNCQATLNVNAAAAPAPAPAPAAPAPAPASAGPCQFILGFATLHDLAPDVVGNCVDNQAFAANGDAQQHTTNGLLAWRKSDNFTAFTNGFMTWVNGPFGLQSRLNTARFPWEHDTTPAASAPPAAAPAGAPLGTASNPIPIQDQYTGNVLQPNSDLYYSLAYPGQNLAVRVRMYFTPSDITGNTGFTLSGSQGTFTPYLTGNGNCLVNINGTSSQDAACSDDDHSVRGSNQNSDAISTGFVQYGPETYMIHVFNRRPQVTNFTLSISGIPYPCQPATSPGGATSAQASVIGQPVVSQLAGSTQGAFAYYRFHYPGDNSGVSLVMFYNPVTPDTRNGVGMNILLGSNIVLQSNAQTMTQAIAQGSTSYADGVLTGFYKSQTAGDYYIQVNNFSPTAINYTLALIGLACPSSGPPPAPAAPAAPDGKTSDTALPLGGSTTGQLAGASIGGLVWYSFDYDGSTRPTINVNYTPADPVQAADTGFYIYGPNGLSVQGGQNGGGPGQLTATLPGSAVAGSYRVQIFNYLPNSTISYTLSRP